MLHITSIAHHHRKQPSLNIACGDIRCLKTSDASSSRSLSTLSVSGNVVTRLAHSSRLRTAGHGNASLPFKKLITPTSG